MMLAKPIVVLTLLLGLCRTSWSQQGFRFKLNSNDTLLKGKPEDSEGFKPVANINTYYRLHLGGAYHFTSGKATADKAANKHILGLNYSITEKSFHPYYRALFPHLVGQWDLSLAAGYDGVRRVNFYGLGNESYRNPVNQQYNWLRTENQYASIGLNRLFGTRHKLSINLLYDGIKVMNDRDRIASSLNEKTKTAPYSRQHFIGNQLVYSFTDLNQALLPTKGVEFSTSAAYTANLNRPERSFSRFTTELALYLPLPKNFSVVNHTGLATIAGTPDFYRLNTLGGTNTLRGFQAFRFYGKTSFFNQTELRWIPSVETSWYKGPLGVFALFDQGRVWQPGEASSQMHYGYGGGVILSPLKNLAVTAAFAASREDRRFHVSIRRGL